MAEGKSKLVKSILTATLIFVLLILIIVKSQVDSFKIGWVILGIFLIAVAMFATWKGADFYNKLVGDEKIKEGDLPPAITIEQAKEFIDKQLMNPVYADYTNGWLQHETGYFGKNRKEQVLLVHLSPTEYDYSPWQFFILNMHYPEKLWLYKKQDKYNARELRRLAERMTTDPEDDPDTEERIETDLSTGKQIVHRKRSRNKSKDKEEKKEGELKSSNG